MNNTFAKKKRNCTMRRARQLFTCVFCILIIVISPSNADEGMWLLDAIDKLPLAEMRKHGLELTPEEIYSTTRPSLKDAIVLVSGGTGSFVSGEGLILTNHHVAFASIQSLSSVQSDYLNEGFYARERTDELPTSYTADMVVDMSDVTAQVLAAVNDTMSAGDRTRAIRSRKLQLEESTPDTAGLRHTVVEMYGGARFYLFTLRQLLDVRLVYAPPGSIGNFGGETDNWTWPRHTGDFTLIRAYVGPDGRPAKYSRENVPYKPSVFLPISTHGYAEGSFAMIMGFPGRTYRYQEAAALQQSLEETIPATIDIYKARIDVMTERSRRDRGTAIKFASRLRSLANTYKKNVALLDGAHRDSLLAVKRSDEALLRAFISSNPAMTKKYGSVLPGLEQADRELAGVNRKNILLTSLSSGVDVLRIASRFIDYLASLPKDSLGSTLEPTEKQRAPLREYIRSTFKNIDIEMDKEILVALILKSAELPPGQRLGLCEEIWRNSGGNERERKVREFVKDLYEESELTTPTGCERLLLEDPDDITNDGFVKFANRVSLERASVQARLGGINSRISELRGSLAEAVLSWKNTGIHYPDANRTLRFTYGQVMPLSPRDAEHFAYATTLTGVMEKETGEDPFIVPPRLKELWKSKDFGRYYDQQLHDLPVAFIANLDITGGNSGSPVINGKGELIGCAFDTNWEGVVSDYRFEDKLNRVISVDARYILFILDKFSSAHNIVKELVIK